MEWKQVTRSELKTFLDRYPPFTLTESVVNICSPPVRMWFDFSSGKSGLDCAVAREILEGDMEGHYNREKNSFWIKINS